MKYNISTQRLDHFINGIFEWYEENKRDYLFWRNTENPFYILISEIMLQKTTVKQVENVITNFMERYPTPQDLAYANLDTIIKIITPLGMENKRAANMKEMSTILIEKYHSLVPASEKELMKLPGVGRYISNAVLSLAFNKQVPIVDTNIIRVLNRFFNIKSNKARPRTDESLWDFVNHITPTGKSRQMNLALLDFGALLCTARNPTCEKCPINNACVYYENTFLTRS